MSDGEGGSSRLLWPKQQPVSIRVEGYSWKDEREGEKGREGEGGGGRKAEGGRWLISRGANESVTSKLNLGDLHAPHLV
eukprot:132805-Amorphochlora_amoeboformis.AAC.1